MSKKKMKHNRIKYILVSMAGIAVIGSGSIFYLNMKQETNNISDSYKKETVRKGSVSTGIQENGTIEYGTLEQNFEIPEVKDVTGTSSEDSSDAASSGTASIGNTSGNTGMQGINDNEMSGNASAMSYGGMDGNGTETSAGEETMLLVEEVCVAVGQKVEKGDAVLKITSDSITDYISELEAAAASAKLLVAQEEINVEAKRAEADYTYQMYLAEGETAKETYNATITSLEDAVTNLEEEIEEEDDEDELKELEAELKIAQNNLTTGSIEAKQTYENAMTNYKYAEQLYEIDTNGLEDDLDAAKDTLAECEANLEEFEAQIGDGTVYAEYSGTVSEVAYAVGDAIVNDAAILICADPENVTMTAAVSQDDIAGIAVGDAVTVYLTAYDGEPFDAEITGISTTSGTGSSTVDYDVTARLSGDTGKVYSGMTGEIMIAGKTVEDTLYISNNAVNLDGTRAWVKVLDDDETIREADIQTGFSNGKTVAVEAGLEEGETVLIESRVTQ